MDNEFSGFQIEAANEKEALRKISELHRIPRWNLVAQPIEEGLFEVRLLREDGSFKIRVDQEGLHAWLEEWTPAYGRGRPVKVEDILHELETLGVVQGVDSIQQEETLKELEKAGQLDEKIIIARGTPPLDGRDASIEFQPVGIVKTLSPAAPAKYLVRQGEVFAQKLPPIAPQSGVGVRGTELYGKGGADKTPDPGEGIEAGKEGVYKALYSGFPSLKKEIQENGRAKSFLIIDPPIIVSKDGLKADIKLSPLANKDLHWTPDLVMELFAEFEVKHGIRTEELPKICRFVEEKKKGIRLLDIAQGKAPTAGIDGRIEYLLATEPQAGALLEDGRMDFRQRGYLQPVEPGQPLAKLIPHTLGEPGISVKGEKIPAKPGQPIRLQTGKNVEIDHEAHLIQAATEGVFRLNKTGRMEVTDLYQHQGDVDYSAGNLEMKGCLTVSGSVRPGFKVEAGADIMIGGMLESGLLEADGSITVTKGIVGRETPMVRAGQKVVAAYAKSAHLESGGDMEIIDLLQHCRVFCGGTLKVMGKSGRLSGGLYVAQNRIEALEIGSSMGIRTRLIVGLTKEDYRKVEDLLDRMEEIREEIKQAKTDPNTQRHYKQMLEEMEEELQTRQAEIPQDLKKCKIIVKKRVHSNTEITFGAHTAEITEGLGAVEFFFDEEKQFVDYKQITG